MVIALIALSLTSLIKAGTVEHPENKILGTWKEVSWKYERVDLRSGKNTHADTSLEHDIFSNLIIHQSESWKFDPKLLVLEKKGQNPLQLHWSLKGRGHILKISHGREINEFYQITELSQNRLVLHMENDVHSRGIVQIVFEKDAG